MTDESKRLVNEDEAGAYLGGLKGQTLAIWRMNGKGPRYLKIGRLVKYRISDLEAWLESRARGGVTLESRELQTA
ncbi:hypothetical protein BH11PLA2_BH11PLA2_51640 [soil metagenome]